MSLAWGLRLVWRGQLTMAFKILHAGIRKDVTVDARGVGHNDISLLDKLVSAGYMEVVFTGPRGGKRWRTTKAGRAALSSDIRVAALAARRGFDL